MKKKIVENYGVIIKSLVIFKKREIKTTKRKLEKCPNREQSRTGVVRSRELIIRSYHMHRRYGNKRWFWGQKQEDWNGIIRR